MGKMALWSFLFIPSQLLSYEVCSLKEGATQTQLRTEISYSNFHSYIISSREVFKNIPEVKGPENRFLFNCAYSCWWQNAVQNSET